MTDVSFLMCTLSEYMRRIALIKFRTVFHMCKTKLLCCGEDIANHCWKGISTVFLGALDVWAASQVLHVLFLAFAMMKFKDALCRLSTSHSCGDADDKRHDVPLVKSLCKAESLALLSSAGLRPWKLP